MFLRYLPQPSRVEENFDFLEPLRLLFANASLYCIIRFSLIQPCRIFSLSLSYKGQSPTMWIQSLARTTAVTPEDIVVVLVYIPESCSTFLEVNIPSRKFDF